MSGDLEVARKALKNAQVAVSNIFYRHGDTSACYQRTQRELAAALSRLEAQQEANFWRDSVAEILNDDLVPTAIVDAMRAHLGPESDAVFIERKIAEAQQPGTSERCSEVGEQPTPPECHARKALKLVVKWLMADEDGKIFDDSYAWAIPFRDALKASREALSTPCSRCQKYSGMTQDGLDGAIAYDALLAERDALLQRVEKLLDALRPFAIKGWGPMFQRAAALLVEHEKEQG